MCYVRNKNYLYFDFLVQSYYFVIMLRIKEGFKGERVVSLPEELVQKYGEDPLTGNLYIRKIGFFPHVKYHYIQKDKGCDYAMLIYCTGGKGWYKIHDTTYPINTNEYVIIPPDTPYSFWADGDTPWTIYWLHFLGRMKNAFLMQSAVPVPIPPSSDSRVQDRINLFEEMYSCFSMWYLKDYMAYSSMCLYKFLASFIFLEQYRFVSGEVHKDDSFSAKAIYYMQENIHCNMTLQHIAARFKYSPSHFSKLFQKETGMSPINYFIRLKIQKACQYLELTEMKVNEISESLGFQDPAYFSRLFQKVMKMSPKNYRIKEEMKKEPQKTIQLNAGKIAGKQC